ncbi:MAG: hypothetical protein JWM80_14 [Cyanobacteria bacterium RYN_339]|nr:hypothetical protein [Cyanobacteria bacterium RYN_339]
MSLANCNRCGRMYHKSSAGRICADCLVEEETHFGTVRDFLEANPGCQLKEIEAATGVDSSIIMRFLREGRLAILGELADGVKGECKRCGKVIDYGKFCKDCVEAMGSELKDSARELGQQSASEDSRASTRRPETLRDRRIDGR